MKKYHISDKEYNNQHDILEKNEKNQYDSFFGTNKNEFNELTLHKLYRKFSLDFINYNQKRGLLISIGVCPICTKKQCFKCMIKCFKSFNIITQNILEYILKDEEIMDLRFNLLNYGKSLTLEQMKYIYSLIITSQHIQVLFFGESPLIQSYLEKLKNLYRMTKAIEFNKSIKIIYFMQNTPFLSKSFCHFYRIFLENNCLQLFIIIKVILGIMNVDEIKKSSNVNIINSQIHDISNEIFANVKYNIHSEGSSLYIESSTKNFCFLEMEKGNYYLTKNKK